MTPSKITLVYFSHCPNVDRARASIQRAGVGVFSEVNQDLLASDHPHKQLSSPTILVNGKIVIGSTNGAASCSMIQWDTAAEKIKKAFIQVS